MIIENVFILAFIAAVLTADMTGFGQFMICRPIFCAPVFGYLSGDFFTGLWIGMIVEMVWTNAVPMGASVPPDLCAISVLSVLWANKYFPGLTSAAVLALGFALPFGYLCRGVDIIGRKVNARIMRWLERGVEAGKYSRISLAAYGGLILFVLKFFVFYLLAMPIGGWVYAALYLKAPFFVLIGLAKAWFLLPILGLGTIAYNFSIMRNRRGRSRKDD